MKISCLAKLGCIRELLKRSSCARKATLLGCKALAVKLAIFIIPLTSCAFDNSEKSVGNGLWLWSMEDRLFYLVDERGLDKVGGVLEGRVLYVCSLGEVAIFGSTRLEHGAPLEWSVVYLETRRIDTLGADGASRIRREYGVDVDTISTVLDFWNGLN